MDRLDQTLGKWESALGIGGDGRTTSQNKSVPQEVLRWSKDPNDAVREGSLVALRSRLPVSKTLLY